VPKFVQLLSEVNFELTEKTTASGSRSHGPASRMAGGKAAARPCGFVYFNASWMFCRQWGQGRQRHSGEINGPKKILSATPI
jgi:hypothetical protein